MKELSREEAIRLHREMWTYVKERVRGNVQSHLLKLADRYSAKREFVKNLGESVHNDCFLCEYAVQQARKDNPGIGEKDLPQDYCFYCPANWCANCTHTDCSRREALENYKCESDCINMVDWRNSPIDDILNIPIEEGN